MTALALAMPASLVAQTAVPEKKPSFEVASIKPNKEPKAIGGSSSGGRQTMIGTTATVLIMNAFNVHDYQIVGAPS